MGLLNIPSGLGPWFKTNLPGFWEWLLFLDTFISTKFVTQGDVTLLTASKGVVLKNADGTITKRIRLNDTGTGIIIEDV